MGDSLIIWNSKKKITISKSSAESEYISLVSTMAEKVWIVCLIKKLGIGVTLPSTCIVIARLQYKSCKSSGQLRTKNIEIDCHFIGKRY